MVSEAFEIYCREIAADELVGKSESQKALWLKTKKRGIRYFIDLTGNVPITSITRQQAQAYYNWWRKRIAPKDGSKGLDGDTANRDLGNMRKLCTEYFKYIGENAFLPHPMLNLAIIARVRRVRQ